jgi:hypothetical protein
MTAKFTKKSAVLLLALLFLAIPCWAGKRVKTDGKNKNSPISVQDFSFRDSGYGQPSATAEIRMSVTVKNTSKEDDLKNVVIKLQAKNLAGDVVKEFEKSMPTMKKGEVVTFEAPLWVNYSFNNLQGAVEIEHDEVEKKDDKKDEKKDDEGK